MRLRLVALALAIAAPAAVSLSPRAPLGGPSRAEASVSVLLSLDELLTRSTYVVVATGGEQRSAWEELPSGKRIVTYTKLTIERAIVGAPSGEIWVRTLGGVVGDIGQTVSGEAELSPGSKSLLFLLDVGGGQAVVTSLAQGHFPLVDGDAKDPGPKLAASRDAGMLLPRRGPAVSARELLVGMKLDAAVQRIQQTKQAQHADKK